MTEVSGPSNFSFSIKALLRKLALNTTPSSRTSIYSQLLSFGSNYHKQTDGLVMGTKMGSSYANLFVGFIAHQFFSQYHGLKPELYGRYIDDCIGATSSVPEWSALSL